MHSTVRTAFAHLHRQSQCASLCFLAFSWSAFFIVPIARTQTIDATNLQTPLELGATGVVFGGDDPSFARPDFDDSAWQKVDESKTMRELFPDAIPSVVWQRVHVKVNPNQTGMGLEAYGVSQAYEVYVNGEKLVVSGRIEPFRRYSEDARIVVPIPDTQVRTGSLTIALRARTLPRWWKATSSAFPPTMISIGNEEALRDHAWMTILRSNAFIWILEFTSIGICGVGLALFLAQRRRFEYMWLSFTGLTSIIELPSSLIRPFHSIPIYLAYTASALDALGGIFIVIMILAFVGVRVRTGVWVYLAVSGILPIFAAWGWLYGIISTPVYQSAQIPYQITVTVGVLAVLIVQWRRGNREAGILFFPMIVWSFTAYLFAGFFLLTRIPSMHTKAQSMMNKLATFSVFGFTVGLGALTALVFFLSLGFIIVQRSIHSSRQQALMESELEATRAIQRIILPENVESVPGFQIESVYQPAQQVGGDFFQILPTVENGLLVVVGDVAGKGLPAAMLVSVLVGAIRAIAEYQKDPAEILSRLNEQMVGRGGSFSTALVANICADGSVAVANAGHLPPYLDGREVELPGALPLGVASGATWQTTRFGLPSGSRLTFYSDGVVEAQNQQGELFGFDRAKAISTQSAEAIVRAVRKFGQEDDITVMTIERTRGIESIPLETTPLLAP